MGEYITKPVCKILMLKGETGRNDGIPSGGTKGQFLKKKSDSDYDYAWTTFETITNAKIDSIVGG